MVYRPEDYKRVVAEARAMTDDDLVRQIEMSKAQASHFTSALKVYPGSEVLSYLTQELAARRKLGLLESVSPEWVNEKMNFQYAIEILGVEEGTPISRELLEEAVPNMNGISAVLQKYYKGNPLNLRDYEVAPALRKIYDRVATAAASYGIEFNLDQTDFISGGEAVGARR